MTDKRLAYDDLSDFGKCLIDADIRDQMPSIRWAGDKLGYEGEALESWLDDRVRLYREHPLYSPSIDAFAQQHPEHVSACQYLQPTEPPMSEALRVPNAGREK